MRFPRSALSVLVLPLLVGCGGPKEIGVSVSPDLEAGRVVIDYEHHDSVVVKPGDEIAWVCDDCPAGTEFAVEGLHRVADVEQVVKMLSDEPTPAPADLQQELCRDLASDLRAAAEEPVEWAPRDVFVDAGERILSGPVPAGIGHEVWKFTWKVRLRGKPESEAKWDPHIYTHPDF